MFYTIKNLSQQNVRIHLHCFEYGRGIQNELNKYCESVNYYPRNVGHRGFSHKYPYIVCSRGNEELLTNLSRDEFPILLEGIHCSYFLDQDRLKNRKVILRLHNVEYKYYDHLRKSSSHLLKKFYYWNESRLLRKYEKRVIAKAEKILAISELDKAEFQSEFGSGNISYLPAFIPWNHVMSKDGMGSFCLYHGNLSVPENEKAATWLMDEVFNDLEIPFVIAGKNPGSRLKSLTRKKSNFCLLENPSGEEMQDLISKAHIHVLPSFNNTGVKFKLLNAVFCGRHCIANDSMVNGSGLETACHIAGNSAGFKSILIQLYHQPFTEEEIHLRNGLLQKIYDNRINAERLIRWIW
ncbi:MAG: mannosyltransferase [Bacteroidetes bacterium]|nr:MAG: mannosyltransferase [Bacteroidota bacterium]